MAFNYEPPTNLVKPIKKESEKRKYNIAELKSKLVCREKLGICFLAIAKNEPITKVNLTRYLSILLDSSYRQQTNRLINELVNLGVIRYKIYEDVLPHSNLQIDKLILEKHREHLLNIKNPFNNQYEKTAYFYLSDVGFEISNFVAEKYGWNKKDE